MANTVFPSVIAKNQNELKTTFAKIKGLNAPWFHLDIMDGKFVKNTSLMFDFKLPRGKKKYEAHLMMKSPAAWLTKYLKKVNGVLLHVESDIHLENAIAIIKATKRRVGLVLNPGTPLSKVKPYLKSIDKALIMSVHPGEYGARYLSSTAKKVRALRKLSKKMVIQVDGGMNPSRIKSLKKAGANQFVVGSYLQKSGDVRGAWKALKE